VPTLITSFSATQRDKCGGGFIGCSGDGENVTSTTFFALDSDKMLLRRGPTSLLPAAENQIVVWDYANAQETVMWVDTSATKPRLINCTRLHSGVPSTPARVAESFSGYIYKAHDLGNTSGLCEGCQQWQWVNQGSQPCPPPHNGTRTSVREPETWTLGAALNSGGGAPMYPLHTMDNQVWNKPCGESARYMFANSDWQEGYTTPAELSLFAVPPDAQCPPPSELTEVRLPLLGPAHMFRMV
jgi:hypothetical protein